MFWPLRLDVFSVAWSKAGNRNCYLLRRYRPHSYLPPPGWMRSAGPQQTFAAVAVAGAGLGGATASPKSQLYVVAFWLVLVKVTAADPHLRGAGGRSPPPASNTHRPAGRRGCEHVGAACSMTLACMGAEYAVRGVGQGAGGAIAEVPIVAVGARGGVGEVHLLPDRPPPGHRP